MHRHPLECRRLPVVRRIELALLARRRHLDFYLVSMSSTGVGVTDDKEAVLKHARHDQRNRAHTHRDEHHNCQGKGARARAEDRDRLEAEHGGVEIHRGKVHAHIRVHADPDGQEDAEQDLHDDRKEQRVAKVVVSPPGVANPVVVEEKLLPKELVDHKHGHEPGLAGDILVRDMHEEQLKRVYPARAVLGAEHDKVDQRKDRNATQDVATDRSRSRRV